MNAVSGVGGGEVVVTQDVGWEGVTVTLEVLRLNTGSDSTIRWPATCRALHHTPPAGYTSSLGLRT